MKWSIVLPLVVLLQNASAQLHIDTTRTWSVDSATMTKFETTQNLGFIGEQNKTEIWINRDEELGGSNFSENGLTVDTLSQAEYDGFLKAYDRKMVMDSSLVQWTDTSFSINGNFFKADIANFDRFEYYLGFLSPLNLHIIWEIDGTNELGTLILADRFSNKLFYYNSPFDEPMMGVAISPSNKYVLSSSNTYYDHDHCFVSILKVNTNGQVFKLTNYLEFYIDKDNVAEMFWIDDSSIVVCLKEVDYNSENADEYITYTNLRIHFTE
jgi:hypothetical protein